ncbi:MAG: hypothetical protein JNN11_00700 [Candidatus Doudnabacteria bacterium]|nr:hypothetical protein [Candidatus Doudnabacteria bacterium]
MELTQEHFDKTLQNLVSKKDLQNLAGKGDLALLREDIEEIKVQNSAIVETLNVHTNVLDQLVKQTKDWNTEMVMVRARLDRHDQWFKQMAEKINIKLDY